jgi:pimeloyl-ACP methyl ester carboxylesterase
MTEQQARSANQNQQGQDSPGRAEEARRKLLATMPAAERRLQLAGISTAVLEGGNGPPVILLHGPSGYAAHWMRVIPKLMATHRVIAPDLPGHGASDVLEGRLDADHVFRWLGELIEQTCASPPALVGQLLGGAIALRFAAAHPARISRLILVDTFGLSPFQPAPEFGQALQQFLMQPTADAHTTLWRQCTFDLDVLHGSMGELWEPFEAYKLDRARAPSIGVPTSLIWGRQDRATSVSIAEAASARFGWPLLVIENCADDPPVEQPDALLRALRTALAD